MITFVNGYFLLIAKLLWNVERGTRNEKKMFPLTPDRFEYPVPAIHRILYHIRATNHVLRTTKK